MAGTVRIDFIIFIGLFLIGCIQCEDLNDNENKVKLYEFCWFGEDVDLWMKDMPYYKDRYSGYEAKATVIETANQTICKCDIMDAASNVMPSININCQNLDLYDLRDPSIMLPLFSYNLDMSWNKLIYVPLLVSRSLKSIILSNNRLVAIDDYIFEHLTVLTHLYLNNNEIEIVSMDAFGNMKLLESVDLSNNRIKHLYTNVFSPLESLLTLLISRNPLNYTFVEEKDDLYLLLGATPKLKELEMDNCNLDKLNIDRGVSLEVVKLRNNNFRETPKIPRMVQYLDLSGNPIKVVNATFLPHLFNLHTLFLEDMPILSNIEEYAFYGMPKLKHINLQGNKNLSSFSGFAFGKNLAQGETDSVLEILNLRGTNLNSLNDTLQFAFTNLTELDLSGNPLVCDCDIKWLRSLNIDTKAQCSRPTSLKGKKLSDVPIGRLECSRWSAWVFKLLNGLLVLLLLVLCGLATWLIIIRLRPSRRNVQKVGSASPYARVTIEPNRAENC